MFHWRERVIKPVSGGWVDGNFMKDGWANEIFILLLMFCLVCAVSRGFFSKAKWTDSPYYRKLDVGHVYFRRQSGIGHVYFSLLS